MTDRHDDDEAGDEAAEDAPARPGPTEGVRILGAEEAQAALDGGQVARRLGGDTPRFGDVPPRPDPSVRPAARFPRPVVDPGDQGSAAGTDDDDGIVVRSRESAPTGRDDLAALTDLADLSELSALDGLDDVDELEADEEQARLRSEVSAIVAETSDDSTHDDGTNPDVFADAGGGDRLIDVSEEDGSGPVPLPHWTEPPTGEVPIILPESATLSGPGVDDELEAWPTASGNTPRFRSGAGDWADADFSDPDALKDDSPALGALADESDDDADFDRSVAQRRRRRLRIRSDDGPTPVAGGPVPSPGAPKPAGPAAGSGTGATVRRLGGPDADETSDGAPGETGSTGASLPTRPRGADLEPPVAVPSPRSDLWTRVVVGLALAVAALICLSFGRGSTALLVTVIVGVAAFEFYEALRKRGFHPATILGLLAAVTTPLAAYKVGESAFPLLIGLLTIFTLLWYLFDVVEARAVVAVAVTVLVYVYIGVLGGFAGLLLVYPNGVGLILGVAICAVAYDVFGYLVGSKFGKTPLATKISPNKTLEGLLGGMTASIVFAALIVNRITPWTDLGHALSLGVVVAIMAPLGDLCESLVKRDLKIKDFGTLLPGHGGVLDRFDGILFCLPAAYYLVRYLKIG